VSLVIVSGLSGAGKSVAMHALEDHGFFCVDNLPAALLDAFVEDSNVADRLTAVSLDGRTPEAVLRGVPAKIEAIRAKGLLREVLFFDAVDDVLIKRFSETRRKHPLTDKERTLPEAITLERELLEGIRAQADSVIDTTLINLHQLRDLIRLRVDRTSEQRLTLLFESFGFKHGLPSGADLVFDVRCLPNPFWEPSLRGLTGRDLEVREFLERQPLVDEMVDSIQTYLEQWVPRFEADNRAYLTINIGCTGGQHRSVYVVEKLAELFRAGRDDVIARHRELPG
jgi:RNase adapter protein RapZ